MSISSRITAIEEHIGNAYDGLEDLGVDLTNVNKNINNIKACLDNIYSAYPKVTGTGKEVVLSGTKKARMEVTPKGESEQKSTKGYQLWRPYNYTRSASGIEWTTTDNGTIKGNGLASATSQSALSSSISSLFYTLSAGSYIISGGTDKIIIDVITSTGTSIASTDTTTGYKTFTLATDTSIQVRARATNGTNLNNETVYPMLETGSTPHDWEQYTGGIPAPNPDFPFPVVNVTGNNSVEVNNKNLYNKDTDYVGGVYSDTGVWNGNVPAWTTSDWIEVSSILYTLSSQTTSSRNSFFSEFDKNKNFIQRTSSTSFTPTANTKYVRLSFKNDIGMYDIQLEIGNQATSYQPYSHQTKPLNLGTLELCKIGNYQDYIYRANGKFYKHSEIEKVTLNGSETWQSYTSIDDNIAQIRLLKDFGSREAKSDKFIVKNDYSATEHLVIGGSLNAIFAHILKSRLSSQTASAFKIWLSNNNIKLYYVLVTPTETELTDTQLINQLNEIYKMNSYDDTTIITTTYSNAQADLTVSALKGA